MSGAPSPAQPTQKPPDWQVGSLRVVWVDGITTYTWVFSDISFYVANLGGTYRITGVPNNTGVLTWVDQADPNPGGCDGYSGGPISLSGMVMEGTFADDPAQGFVLQEFLIGPSIATNEGAVFEYSVNCGGSPETRQIFPYVVPTFVDTDVGDAPFAIESLVRAVSTPGGAAQFQLIETQEEGTVTATGDITPTYTIQVAVDESQLDAADPTDTTRVTVTATMGGLPLRNDAIQVKICTKVDTADDGHVHDTRTDPCDKSRPVGSIDTAECTSPLDKTTDQNGQVTMVYASPVGVKGTHIPHNPAQLPISGTDQITATLTRDQSVQDMKEVVTKVEGLQLIDGAADCSGGSSYYFVSQQAHTCFFYGTASTLAGITNIANTFWQAQIDCQDGTNNKYGTMPDGSNFSTPGAQKKLRITAMSLPWGGLLDIYGDWSAPHSTHDRGVAVDVGWADFATGPNAWDDNYLYLLQAIINAPGSNATLPYANEGGDIPTTKGQTNNAHFHIQFAQ